jgi:uncharacterized cupredoxin-like copper-binding protein
MRKTLGFAVLAWTASTAFAHGDAHMAKQPTDVAVKRGETVKFIVANSGKVLHEKVLGTTEELKAHVKPGTKGEIVWQFTKVGEYQFACLIPGHYEAGMVGRVVVK